MPRLFLLRAYQATSYRCFDQGLAIDIRLGQRCPALDLQLGRHRIRAAACITAWNPQSRPTPSYKNHRAAEALIRQIARGGWAANPHWGLPDRADWSPEAGLLILGITRRAARALATRFRQNALVYCRSGEPARLVLTGWISSNLNQKPSADPAVANR